MSCSLGTNPTAVLTCQVTFCSGTQSPHETSKRRLNCFLHLGYAKLQGQGLL